MLETLRGGEGCEMIPARNQEFDLPDYRTSFLFLPPNYRTLLHSVPPNYRTCATVGSDDEHSSKEGRLGGHFQRERIDTALVDLNWTYILSTVTSVRRLTQ